MYNKNNNSQRPKDLGIGYRKSYKDKKTGQDVSYLKISLRPEILATAIPGKTGMIELVVFPNSGPKKSDKSPDVTVKLSETKAAGGTNATATPKAAGGASSGFPF
jgi:hypothetical protein